MPTPVEAARAVAPAARARADETERGRRLPPELVQGLIDAGLFRLCVPRALGGLEADPATLVDALEEVARGDGSAGWCAMIGATSGVVAAYLPFEVAMEIYGRDPRAVTGGVFAPHGVAVPDDRGYRVTGRWPYATGCEHTTWLMGGCTIADDRGAPVRMVLFPTAEARVIDTWTVAGLRGTGSHDVAVTDLAVPRERSVSLVADRPRQGGPLYAMPVFGLLAIGIAAVALGIARAAVEELVVLAGGKTPTGSRRLLRDRSVVQAEVATAEGDRRAARSYLHEAIDVAWRTAQTGGALAAVDRAALRLAATHATLASARVVDRMYTVGGGTAIYASSPLQRHFRDVHVVTQHQMVAAPTLELCGRALLGLEVDGALL